MWTTNEPSVISVYTQETNLTCFVGRPVSMKTHPTKPGIICIMTTKRGNKWVQVVKKYCMVVENDKP